MSFMTEHPRSGASSLTPSSGSASASERQKCDDASGGPENRLCQWSPETLCMPRDSAPKREASHAPWELPQPLKSSSMPWS